MLESFLSSESYEPDMPQRSSGIILKIVTMSMGRLQGRLAILNFRYLIGELVGVRHFTERHQLALFIDVEWGGLASAGLELYPEHRNLTGRGVYVVVAP